MATVKYSERETYLHPKVRRGGGGGGGGKPPLIFKTLSNPLTNALPLRQLLTKYWGLIDGDKTLGKLFPEPPTICWKRHSNIKEKANQVV